MMTFLFYIAAFGLFTDVSYETNQDLKNILGHAAYILEGTQRLFNIASYQLKVETKDTSFDGDFIFGMVSNATSVGGFRKLTGPDVLLDDGVFEVLLIRRPKNILELNEIITALLGGADTSNIESFKTSYLKIDFGDTDFLDFGWRIWWRTSRGGNPKYESCGEHYIEKR